ncbi:MAG TPA: trypsin-like peptidase domain-containing protein [Planctomycetota bacterium]|nr:trypsin-like peptidase domain-containing protein [Planctomycetota bacterium]
MKRTLPILLLLPLLLAAGPGCGPSREEFDGAVDRLDFRQVVRRAKERVFPAVVFIKCLSESYEGGRKLTREVSGSGVIVSPEGEVLTNWHVVEKATEIRCLLYSGESFAARLVGTDKDTDLALLRREAPAGKSTPLPPLPCATLGDSTRLVEGDFVLAMGAPWGMSRSVSIGIVSCPRRYLPGYGHYSLWLQTDASISPGNSGGPMVNAAGEVVGINTLSSFTGGDLGFAVPSETVSFILPQLREHGRVNWSWTGLELQPLRDFDKNIAFEASEGVVVAGTDPESPARRAGVQPRDRLLRVNGRPVTALTAEDLPAVRRLLGSLPRQQPAKLELLRGEEPVTVEITPRDKGSVEGEALDCPRWDLTVKAINEFENPGLHFQRRTGVFVYGVKYPGNAWGSGLRHQDIIVRIDGREVKTLPEVKAAHAAALTGLPGRPRVPLVILRGGVEHQIVLTFSRDYDKE